MNAALVYERDAILAGEEAQTHLGAAFLAAADAAADKPAFVTPAGSVTYATLAEQVQAVADSLVSRKVWRPRERVALLVANSAEYAAGYYGSLLAGGIVLPLPADIPQARLDTILQATGCRCVITTGKPGNIHDESSLTIETVASPPPAELPEIPAELAAVYFTSGSTGDPKGVMLSHRNLLANAAAISQVLEIQADDRALGLLPFCHAFGNSVLQTALLNGATIVIDGTLSFPESIVQALRKHRITSLYGVPDVYRVLLQHSTFKTSPPPELRSCAVAGGALRHDIALEVAAAIEPARLFIMYGQTEATARLSILSPHRLKTKPGSIGQGLPATELQVVDDQDRPVAPGETGELRARGPSIMLGYWGDAQLTQSVLRDGWLATGDLATVDDEGFVYPRGRANAVTKIAGFRVHPAEVEEAIVRCCPDVEAVAVAYEHKLLGTRLALFLVPRSDREQLQTEFFVRICRDQLPRHAWPAHVEILEAWPLNSSFKVDRPALAARAADASRA